MGFSLEKPGYKDDWIIFHDAILSSIKTADCNDAINGMCYDNKTFNECLEICDKSPECNFGYYLTSDEKNICVPLKDFYQNTTPYYRIRNKRVYRELKDSHSEVFVDREKYPFPPENVYKVFFRDTFCIKNVETGKILESSPISTETMDVVFEKDGNLQLHILQIPENLSVGENYVIVRYGDTLTFNIPGTTLVTAEDRIHSEHISWLHRSFSLDDSAPFILVHKTKKEGDDVEYSDIFYIRLGVFTMYVDEDGFMREFYGPPEKAIQKGLNIEFKFIPKMEVFDCKTCQKYSLEKAMQNGRVDISRFPHCFGLCEERGKSSPFSSGILIFILLLFVIAIVYYWRYRRVINSRFRSFVQ